MTGPGTTPEPLTVVTEEMHTSARVMLETMSIGLLRKRRILELRERADRLESELLATREALAIEVAEQADESRLIRDMWEQWRSDIERRKVAPDA